MTLQEALDATAADHGPGLYGLVTDGGAPVFSGAAGVGVPGPDDPVRIGSVTKTYVAALVLALGVDPAETVEEWVPGGAGITVDLLLRMRSGLPDYGPLLLGDPPDLSRLARSFAPSELVGVALTGPDRLPPDTVHRYCNTDYILLGLVIERATGRPVHEVLRSRLLEPAGLTRTLLPPPGSPPVGPAGHLRTGPGPYESCPEVSPSEGWTAGAMLATPRELARFLDALLGGSLLEPAALARLTDAREVLDDRCRRGLGIVRYAYPSGTVAYGAHGGVPGWTTVVQRTTTGRTAVLTQTGIDLHAPLLSANPFFQAALTP